MRIARSVAPITLLALSTAACSGGDGGGGGSGVHGFVAAGLSRDAFGDSFGGSAVFIDRSIPIPDFDTADGTCVEGGSGELSGSANFRDVGETVTITTGTGELVMNALIPGIYFGDGADTLWAMGETVTFETAGGAVDSFTRDFEMSGAFTLTTPDPTLDLTIDRAVDFTLAWASSGATDPILVTIEQYDFDTDETPFSLTCRFDDDGSATISSSFLEDMVIDPDLDTDVSISKERLTFIEDVPGIGTIVGAGSVSYSLFADEVQ